ncbi:CocE/NonD family hydrolase [uncultured Xylophilus sp.]|uniref:CocE/NonD family hydrolase n=1 Tax=uncultured Xylophilus sp. TaxID=296832 RepID=UPI0025F8EAD9|nr:CocE/NonD family hydrolase [uncultured Xylophilus sp.]
MNTTTSVPTDATAAEDAAGGLPLRFERDVPIPMSDGTVLRCNVFRPREEGTYPVVMALGAYGKDVHFADAFAPQWKVLTGLYPGLATEGSTGRFLRWEVVDPERWVPDGFVVIQVDARGTGRSPGFLDPFGPVETRDYYECIEWAGTQPWSNGRVGLIGVSYLAIKQWQVAALRPPHLAAIVPWEGSADFYRDGGAHGGIFSSSFTFAWWPRQVLSNQYGSGDSTHRDRDTGERTTGPAFSPALLEGNRAEHPQDRLRHRLDDAWNRARTGRLSEIEVPVLSAANWGGAGMHLRGNVEGYLAAGSAEKWLFAHIGTHYESFYLPRYVALQKRFLGHYLRGDDNGWEREPRVQLAIRRPDGTATLRAEHEWPLARTQWTPFYLDAGDGTLDLQTPRATAQASFTAMSGSLDFSTAPFTEEAELTGPVALRLWISSSTADADLFVVLRVFGPDGRERTFIGAHEPVPMAQGWLRASHRKLDPDLSQPYRPYHAHDEVQKLEPGTVYPVDVEIWPTSMVFPLGYRLVLTVQGHDFVVAPPGRLLHDHPEDRAAPEFAGTTTLHTGPAHPALLLVPRIPAAAV